MGVLFSLLRTSGYLSLERKDWSPLHYAILKGEIKAAVFLIGKNADLITINPDCLTPLTFSIERNHSL